MMTTLKKSSSLSDRRSSSSSSSYLATFQRDDDGHSAELSSLSYLDPNNNNTDCGAFTVAELLPTDSRSSPRGRLLHLRRPHRCHNNDPQNHHGNEESWHRTPPQLSSLILALQELFATGQTEQALQLFWTNYDTSNIDDNDASAIAAQEATVKMVMRSLARQVKRQPLVGLDRLERFVHNLSTRRKQKSADRAADTTLLAATAILVEAYAKQGWTERALATLDRVVVAFVEQQQHHHQQQQQQDRRTKINDDTEQLPVPPCSSFSTAKQHHLRNMVTHILQALAKSHGHTTMHIVTAPILAERLYQRLTIEWCIPADCDTTRWYLYCLLQDRRVHPVRATQYAHEKLLVLLHDDDTNNSVDRGSYEMLLDRWCHFGYPAHAETWLFQMLDANMAVRTDHFVRVLTAWIQLIDRNTSRDDAVVHMNQIFDSMLHERQRLQQQQRRRQVSFPNDENVVVPPPVLPVQPTRALCETWLSALELSRCAMAPALMQKIFSLAIDDPTIGVDVVMFHQVVTAWHRCKERKDIVAHVENLVRSVQRYHPELLNTYSYNAIIAVYVKHDRADKGVEIFEQWLESQPQRRDSSRAPRPSLRSYMILMEAFVDAHEPGKATVILEKLMARGPNDLMASARKSYTALFNELLECWLWNGHDEEERSTVHMIRVIRCMAHLSKWHDVAPDDQSIRLAWSSLQFCQPDELGQLTIDLYNMSVELGVSKLREQVQVLATLLRQFGHSHVYEALQRELDNDQPKKVTMVPRDKSEMVPQREGGSKQMRIKM
jgi:pentatricopeptide repeat protein